MKAKTLIKKVFQSFFLIGMISTGILLSCSKEDPVEVVDPIASFQFEVSDTNYLAAIFTNYSANATSYLWDFGDGNSSVESDPVHIYTAGGTYTVSLIASNSSDVDHEFSAEVTITDPNSALAALTGEVSKSWKLYRVGISMGIGETPAKPMEWWSLTNDGSRTCLYKMEWTFKPDGTFDFNDHGEFWGEANVFDGDLFEVCFPADASNMINSEGTDVSAWLSGTHQFTFDPTKKELILTGEGAWIGLVKVTPGGDVNVPQQSVKYDAFIEELDTYDLLHVSVTGTDFYWEYTYASYDNPADEPALVEIEEPFGEDLEDITPTEMYNDFSSASSFVLIDTTLSGAGIEMGVTDPAGGATPVGKYIRIAGVSYQELQLKAGKDIQFDNFTQFSIDVYVPASNDYTGDLTKDFSIGIAETSQTKEWWNGHIQYDVGGDTVSADVWKTYTFQLDAPTSGPGFGTYTPFDRDDLDMIYIVFGGTGHGIGGDFYIRNFVFE